MSQGMVIKGKTIDGQTVALLVDSLGRVVSDSAAITRFDPSDAKPDYIGTNTKRSALDTDTTWTILKFTRNGLGETTLIQQATGAWSNRASINYTV